MSSWIDVVNKECSWIRIYYGVLSKYIKEKGYKDMIEIGVAYGGHAEELLANTEVNYTGIDPYLAGYDPNDGFVRDVHRIMKGRNPQHSMDLLYEGVCDRLSPYEDRYKLLRKASADQALFLDDEAYDLIFIDGNHLYDAVKLDVNLYWDKLRSGGTFCGDDYNWPGVRRAVNEFAQEQGLTVKQMKDNYGKPSHWYIIKP